MGHLAWQCSVRWRSLFPYERFDCRSHTVLYHLSFDNITFGISRIFYGKQASSYRYAATSAARSNQCLLRANLSRLRHQQSRSIFRATVLSSFSSLTAPASDLWKNQVVALLEQGLVQDAQTTYEQALSTMKDAQDGNIRDLQIQLFDAWIVHQQQALHSLQIGRRSLTYTNTTSTQSSDQESLLQNIVTSAKISHNLLEQMEPFLGARNVLLTRDQLGNQKGDGDAGLTAPRVGNIGSAGSNTHSKREIDHEVTQRCDAVLTAWAQAVRACHECNLPSTWIRAVPQRAQFLLERMEAAFESRSSGDHVAAVVVVQPSLQSYHCVLQAWAYSAEHLRGTSAERLFVKLAADKAGTPLAAKAVHPNAETYRLMLWAWAQSKDPRAAFTATGYLMKMLRRLELGLGTNSTPWDDGPGREPTIEDYHVVFQAWARSE
jgi:hypothetical protein